MDMTRAQLGLWMVNQLRPADAEYHVPAAFEVTGPVDQHRLRAALDDVVAAHEVLRGYYPVVADQPVMRLRPPHPVDWDVFDDVRTFLRRPFDLTTDDVIRAGVGHRDDKILIALCVHHIACDGDAMRLICQEWGDRYAGTSVARPPSFAEAIARRREAALVSRQRLERFWRAQVDGPLLMPESPVPETGRPGASCTVRISGHEADKIASRARSSGLTGHMLLLAAYMAVLADEFDQRDITVGVPAAARGPRDAGVVGCLVTVLPIRVRNAVAKLTPDLLGDIRSACLEAYAHQDMPAEDIGELRGGRPRPLYDAAFNLTSGPRFPLRLPGLEVRPVDVDLGTVQVPLDLDADWTGGISLKLRHDREIVPAARAEAMLHRMIEVL